MTQLNPRNSAPQLILNGFDDQSTRLQVAEAEPLPMHLPLFYTFAQRGPTTPQLVSGASLVNTYGDKTLDYRGPYATHATPFIRVANEAANAMLMVRLEPVGAAVATLRIGLDVLPKELPVYERDSNGFYVRDNEGALVETGEFTPGFIGRWVLEQVIGGVGSAAPRAGSMSEGVTQSQIYPIADVPVSSFGAWGTNLGIRLWAPTTLGADPIDDDLVAEQDAYIYRLQVVERLDNRNTPNVWKTIFDQPYVEFALKDGAINTRVESELFVDRVVQASYRNMEATPVAKYGPFEQFFVYHNHVQTLSGLIFANESVLADNLPEGEGNEYLINLFGATNVDGTPYHSFMLEGALDSAPEMVENATHYFLGGADGTMGMTAYNAAVKEALDTFHNGDILWEDMARYPFSAFYDSGFDLETKKSIAKIMGVRKDVHVAVGTQNVLEPALNTAEESSVAVALRAALRLYPESTLYGTVCCRAVIMAQSGLMFNSNWPYRVPGTLELLAKRCRYMGSADGIMKSPFSYDNNPVNLIEYLYDISNPSKSQSVRNRDWSNGLVWAQNYDRTRLFIPAFQTVYDRADSVLNSDINMQIAVELNKVCFRVWSRLVGNSQLTRDQFIQRSNELIIQETLDRFDGRVTIVPDTYFTDADDARGYSWSCRIHMYGNVMKTVKMATVVTHRLEDLE